MLNYELTNDQILGLYKNLASEDELEELREKLENASDRGNIIASLRDHAQRMDENGNRQYSRILRTLEL